MKKKFLTFLLVLLIIPCAFIITACGGSDARLLNFYIVDKNGEIQNSFCYAGGYDYGVSLSEILEGVKIKADYSDNSSKELSSSDYTTVFYKDDKQVSEIKSTPDAGIYKITYKKENYSVDIFFDVYKVNYYNVNLTSSWDYDDELPTISLSNYSIGQNEKVDYYYIEESDYENLNDYQNIIGSGYEKIWNGTLYSIKAGKYYAFANITFASENQNYLGLTNPRPFTVNKAQINVTQDDIQGLSAFHEYDATKQTGDIKLSTLIQEGFYEKTIKNSRGDDVQGYFVWKDPDTLVNASNNGHSYPIIFKADNENYDCYESNEINLQITIKKAVPGNKNSMTMVFEDNDLAEIEFDNQEHNIKLENFPISSKDGGDLGEVFPTVELKDSNGNDVALKWHDSGQGLGYFYIEGLKEIGEYTFTLSLTDKTNVCWEDGSTDPIEFTVKIVGDGSILNVFGNYDSVNPDTDGEDVLYKQYLTNWLGNGDYNSGQINTVAQDYSADVRLVFKSQGEYNFDEIYVGQIHNTDLTISVQEGQEGQEEQIYSYTTNSSIQDKNSNTFNIVGFVDLVGANSSYEVNDNPDTVIHNDLENAILSSFSIYLFQDSVGENVSYSVAQDSQYLKIKLASELDNSNSEVYLIFDVTTGDFIGHRICIEHPDGLSYTLVELKLINE